MAFRSIGVYLLTSSALYAQKKTVYHVGKMTKLASESAALTMQAGEELESSIEMSEKAAIESEEGFELQSESIGKHSNVIYKYTLPDLNLRSCLTTSSLRMMCMQNWN